MEKRLLESIELPSGVKKLNKEELNELCSELRSEILDKVSKTGGHIASNLGAVELTVALHYVFDSPSDSIVWDVGHQCYAHKILTGRDITGIRCEGGLSGFPKSAESEHDFFVAGHASTSISSALGLAEAKKLKGDASATVAVIGDGAASGGMVYEAINNAGRSNTNLVVVLNDNEMSISKNVGAMSKYLSKIRSKEGYFRLKDATERIVRAIPLLGDPLYRFIKYVKTAFKDYYYGSNTFENFGFTYLGPVDGHDVQMLIRVLNRAKSLKCPVLVHINTVKGKGYDPAEQNPSLFHGISPFNVDDGKPVKQSQKSYSEAFGESICRYAADDSRVCAITAAMTDGTGLTDFALNYPDRFFDVGIAEEHALTFAAGLAKGGMKPVFAVYATFLQRAYDQAIHDAAIEPKHVVLAVDRAGIVGGDGETHQGTFDVPILTSIPGITIYSPSSFKELDIDLGTALGMDSLVAVRYPRDTERLNCEDEDAGSAYEFIKKDKDKLIICYGRLFATALEVSENTGCSVLKMNKIFPIEEYAADIAMGYKFIVFPEESVQNGSIAEHFGTKLNEKGYKGTYIIKCVEGFVPHMSVDSAMKKQGIDSDSLTKIIEGNMQ